MVLHTYHDSVFGGHLGCLTAYKRLTGELYREGMKVDVQKYCEECLACQRNKTMALSPAGLLMSLEIADAVWSEISMDFIDGLPKSKGHEVILVVDIFLKRGQTSLLNETNAQSIRELY